MARGIPNGTAAKLGGGVAVQHPAQLHEYLLCADCERRMKVGEDYVHGVVYQDDYRTAPLLDLVGNVVHESNGVRLALAGRLDPDLLAYFGISVAWRGAVSTLVPDCVLRPDDTESLRRYLLAETPLPNDVACFVTFHDIPYSERTHVASIFTPPGTSEDYTVGLLLFGLQYQIVFGDVAATMRPLCVVHGPQPLVGLAPQSHILDWLDGWFQLQRPVGALAKLIARP